MKLTIHDVEHYKPFNKQEEQDKNVLLKYMNTFDDLFYRENVFGHMTSSPWIVNKDASKVLMIYHNIYNSWGWCGGHCDGDDNMQHVALKEGKEETGLTHLTLVSEDIFALDILPVPPHIKHNQFVSSHVHLNLTYLCIADEEEALHIKVDENSGVKWIPVEDMNDYVTEEDMKVVYQKLVEKTKLYISK